MKFSSHAVIMVSKDPQYNRQEARRLAEQAAVYKENVYWIESDGSSVKDKAVEDLLVRLSYKPLIGDINVAVIDDADTITERAQNRLLKTLEEPPGKVLIILLSQNEENLLATVRSRCGIYKLWQAEGENDISPENRKLAQDLVSRKPYYVFMDPVKAAGADKGQAISFLDEIKRGLKEILFSQGEYERAHRLVTIVEEGEKEIKANVRRDFALKNTILKILEENS